MAAPVSNEAVLLDLFGDAELWHPQTATHACPLDVLKDCTVMLYFSASWCMPCVRFTPALVETYNNLKQRQATTAGERIEVVLCSMDKDTSAFYSYASKMPWYVIPMKSMAVTLRLAAKFGAHQEGIPHVTLLSRTTGECMPVDDVMTQIKADPLGERFPWPPKPLVQLFPTHYFSRYQNLDHVNGDCHHHPWEERPIPKDKYIMLYFAAHWSAPCRKFGPILNRAYLKIMSQRSDFELILVSADRYEDEFLEHIKGISFGVIPYQDEQCRMDLNCRLKIREGPALVMLSPHTMDVVNPKISPHIFMTNDSTSYLKDFPFMPRPYGDLKDFPMEMNHGKCVLVFCEGADDEIQADVMKACQTAALELQPFVGAACDKTTFVSSKKTRGIQVFWTLVPNVVSSSIRQVTHMDDYNCGKCPGKRRRNSTIQMVLMDLPDNGSYYIHEVSTDTSQATDSKEDKSILTAQDILQFCNNPGIRRELA